ncbi:hypothetical protein Ancab_040460 [Ancistrocladus abbreviatus]
MFYEVDMLCRVGIPREELDDAGVVSQRSIITRVLKNLLWVKSSKDLGYYLSITNLKGIGKGESHGSERCIYFPVSFTCRTFIPRKGEIMHGVVYWVHNQGVFLRCGSMKVIFLAAQKMADYHYQPGKEPAFQNESLSRIEIGVVLLFMVFAVRWVEQRGNITREFQVLASIEGDSLGPVSLTGTDGLDL